MQDPNGQSRSLHGQVPQRRDPLARLFRAVVRTVTVKAAVAQLAAARAGDELIVDMPLHTPALVMA
jgi:hypothetical protein